MEDRLSSGHKLRWLNIIDEYTRECLACIPKKSWKHKEIMEVLSRLFVMKGTPEYLRSDNGSEFIAKMLKQMLSKFEVKPTYIAPGSPWENGYCESFNSRMRDEFLNGEVFDTMKEAEILTEIWMKEYNQNRPHSALGYRPPAPQSVLKIA